MTVKYDYYYQAQESNRGDLEELFYEIKEDTLMEIRLSDSGYLWVKQRKDVPMTYDTKDKSYDMSYGAVYLTDWTTILDVRDWWWEKELGEWLLKCKRKEQEVARLLLKKYGNGN